VSAASLELASTPARQPVVLVSTIGLGLMLSVEALFRGRLPLAVYALSFWHYLLYGLAFCIGAVPLRELKRDALATKAVALTALGIAYLGAPVDAVSVTVVGGGFLLNALGARSLGPDRTYYGRELAALPLRRVTSFPYSWMSHPMLVGNMAAFAGTLLNADFRRRWPRHTWA